MENNSRALIKIISLLIYALACGATIQWQIASPSRHVRCVRSLPASGTLLPWDLIDHSIRYYNKGQINVPLVGAARVCVGWFVFDTKWCRAHHPPCEMEASMVLLTIRFPRSVPPDRTKATALWAGGLITNDRATLGDRCVGSGFMKRRVLLCYMYIGTLITARRWSVQHCCAIVFITLWFFVTSICFSIFRYSLNVRVVLLIRDPRGSMQSRKHRVWCPGRPDCDDPSTVCSDMQLDYEAAIELSQRFPQRFR